MRMKVMGLSILFFVLCSSTIFSQTPEITVFFNEVPLQFEETPLLEGNSTLIQFRPLLEKLGAQIQWNENEKKITASKDNLEVVLEIGKPTAQVNGIVRELEMFPKIVNGHTMIPLRFVTENLGAEVRWDKTDGSIRISTPMSKKTPSKEEVIQIQPKLKLPKDRYEVEMISNRQRNIASKSDPKTYGLITDNSGNVYYLFDENAGGYFMPFQTLHKIDLKAHETSFQAAADTHFTLTYGSNEQTLTAYYDDFYPTILAFNPFENEITMGGVYLEDEMLFSIHTRLPSVAYWGHQKKSYNSKKALNNFMRYSGKDSIVYSDLDEGALYEMKAGKPPTVLYQFSKDVKLSGEKIDGFVTADTIYLFDSKWSTLYKINRASETVETIFKKDQMPMDSVTFYNNKFYTSSQGNIYEINLDGTSSLLINAQQYDYVTGDFGNFSQNPLRAIQMMAFDNEENIIVYDRDIKAFRRIKR